MVNADKREAEWTQGNHYKTHGDVCHGERQAVWEICQEWVKLELLGGSMLCKIFIDYTTLKKLWKSKMLLSTW